MYRYGQLKWSRYTVAIPNQDNSKGPARMIVAIVGVAILVISVVGGMLLACRTASDRQRQTKILLFVLYFWALAFVQLIVAAIGYSVMAR